MINEFEIMGMGRANKVVKKTHARAKTITGTMIRIDEFSSSCQSNCDIFNNRDQYIRKKA